VSGIHIAEFFVITNESGIWIQGIKKTYDLQMVNPMFSKSRDDEIAKSHRLLYLNLKYYTLNPKP